MLGKLNVQNPATLGKPSALPASLPQFASHSSESPAAPETFRSFEENLKDNISKSEARANPEHATAHDHPQSNLKLNIQAQAKHAPEASARAQTVAAPTANEHQNKLEVQGKTSEQDRTDGAAKSDKLNSSENSDEASVENLKTVSSESTAPKTKLVAKTANKLMLDPAQTSPVADFLKSMQEELKVEPDQIISALKTLSASELQESPDEALPKLLAKLNLKDDQLPRAQQLVSHLLQDLKSSNLAVEATKLGPDQQKHLQALLEVDHTVRQIFLKEQKLPYAGMGKAADENSEDPQGIVGLNMLNQISDQNMSVKKVATEVTSKPATQPKANLEAAPLVSILSGNKPDATPSLTALAEPDDADNTTLNDLMSKSNLGIQSAVFKSHPGADASAPVVAKPVVTTGEALQRMNIVQAGGRQSANDSGKGSSQQNKSAMSDQALTNKISNSKVDNAAAGIVPTTQFATILNKNDSNKLGAADTTAQKNENVEQLTQQTQGALKKGGGEMVMKLTPEGMGQVHLKVAVVDGKVHVQMLAESAESKRLLESHVDDLKKSLETHNIRVDHMKIDVADSSNMGNSTDANAHREQSQRDLAQQFSGNFSERQENARQSMLEGRSTRGYRQPAATPTEMGVLASQAKAARESNRRLNLVA